MMILAIYGEVGNSGQGTGKGSSFGSRMLHKSCLLSLLFFGTVSCLYFSSQALSSCFSFGGCSSWNALQKLDQVVIMRIFIKAGYRKLNLG